MGGIETARPDDGYRLRLNLNVPLLHVPGVVTCASQLPPEGSIEMPSRQHDRWRKGRQIHLLSNGLQDQKSPFKGDVRQRPADIAQVSLKVAASLA